MSSFVGSAWWFGGTSLSAEHEGSTPHKKGAVAVQSAFIGKNAYSRKNTSADSSVCASLTCESRAYSVVLQEKAEAQQGSAVYLTVFHTHYASVAKALSVSPCVPGLRGTTGGLDPSQIHAGWTWIFGPWFKKYFNEMCKGNFHRLNSPHCASDGIGALYLRCNILLWKFMLTGKRL